MDLEEIDKLALIHWQNDLAKFFTTSTNKRNEPNYVEYNMFAAGFKAALQSPAVSEYAKLVQSVKDNPHIVGEEWEIKELAFLEAVEDVAD